jgi:hypothetical protein
MKELILDYEVEGVMYWMKIYWVVYEVLNVYDQEVNHFDGEIVEKKINQG